MRVIAAAATARKWFNIVALDIDIGFPRVRRLPNGERRHDKGTAALAQVELIMVFHFV
jgi:hypothetical protein